MADLVSRDTERRCRARQIQPAGRSSAIQKSGIITFKGKVDQAAELGHEKITHPDSTAGEAFRLR
jgi:hypothetical protein